MMIVRASFARHDYIVIVDELVSYTSLPLSFRVNVPCFLPLWLYGTSRERGWGPNWSVSKERASPNLLLTAQLGQRLNRIDWVLIDKDYGLWAYPLKSNRMKINDSNAWTKGFISWCDHDWSWKQLFQSALDLVMIDPTSLWYHGTGNDISSWVIG